MTRCVALIPARIGSSRLPEKPLLKDTGKFLIQHVYERVAMAKSVEKILVATDDARIVTAVQSFGGEALLTSKNHPSGTDRIAEVARKIQAEIVLNVQGDEPDISPELLDALITLFKDSSKTEMATAAVAIQDEASYLSPHVVKVVLNKDNRALYFSRAPIPQGALISGQSAALKHIGVYAYRREVLLRLAQFPTAPLEKAERLEQLRALHHGFCIQVILTDRDHLGIDTKEEYEAFVKQYKGE